MATSSSTRRMIGGIEETSASFEARSAPRSYPTAVTAIVTHADVKPSAAVEVRCEAPDIELLFVEWLNAIIYEMAVRAMLFARFVVCIDGEKLIATLWGEPVDVARHTPACEPKGATYTALRVSKAADGQWSAACVVDV